MVLRPLLEGVLAVAVILFFQAEDGIRDLTVTGVQTCALPISAEVAQGGDWLAVHAGPLRDEQGAIVAGLALVHDIPAAKGAEQVLRASEARFREIGRASCRERV